MKTILYVLMSIVLFLVAFSFVIHNPHNIKIHYYFGMVWDGPIATLLILTLSLGVLFGVLVSSFGLLRLKLRLRKAAKRSRSLHLNHSLEREQITKEGG